MSCKISGILVRHTSFLKRKIILTFLRWHVLCTVHYRQSMVQSMHKNSLFTSVSQCCTQLLCFGVTLVITLPKRHATCYLLKRAPQKNEGNSFVFPRIKHQDSRENKINWFPKGPGIKCFVIFLEFHFNSNKRITGANQNSRLGTYNNTNLILKTTGWMIYKVPSLYYLHHFPPLAAVFLLGTSWITLKIVAF